MDFPKRKFTEAQLERKRELSKLNYLKNKVEKYEKLKSDRLKNPEKHRLRSLKYNIKNKYKLELRRLHKVFNLTQNEYENMLCSQLGLCKICNTQMLSLNVDHCHTTGKVRGLLCKECNLGLGLFKDNPNNLQKAILYLQKGLS